MKKILPVAIFALSFFFQACSGKESAKSVAQKWCDLNAKVYKAEEGDAKEAAKKARKAYEDNMEKKYKGNDAFLREVAQEVEKCEDASEGR